MAVTQIEEETQKLIAILGGPKVFPIRIRNTLDLQSALRNGFPYETFEAVLDVLGLNSATLARFVGVASRTLARRKTSRLLSPIESDRLYRLAFVALRASDVLGSEKKARMWLHQSNQALGGETPISQLDTEIGERRVEDLLYRINYGIVS